jgi:hypothetical protein
MITSALLRTETERWREMCYLSSSEVLSAGFLAGLAWHDISFYKSVAVFQVTIPTGHGQLVDQLPQVGTCGNGPKKGRERLTKVGIKW